MALNALLPVASDMYASDIWCFMNAPMMNSLSSEGLMLEAKLVSFLVF